MLIIDVCAPCGWWWFFSADSLVVCHPFRAHAVEVAVVSVLGWKVKPLGHTKVLCGTLHLAILTMKPGFCCEKESLTFAPSLTGQ